LGPEDQDASKSQLLEAASGPEDQDASGSQLLEATRVLRTKISSGPSSGRSFRVPGPRVLGSQTNGGRRTGPLPLEGPERLAPGLLHQRGSP
jgi:hypothetical protein